MYSAARTGLSHAQKLLVKGGNGPSSYRSSTHVEVPILYNYLTFKVGRFLRFSTLHSTPGGGVASRARAEQLIGVSGSYCMRRAPSRA
jgi:hypothetical protein